MTRVATVVLAAGESRRMGSPKQLLRIGRVTLVRRAAEVALATQLEETTKLPLQSSRSNTASCAGSHTAFPIGVTLPAPGSGQALRSLIVSIAYSHETVGASHSW